MLNRRQSPIADAKIEDYSANSTFSSLATRDKHEAHNRTDCVVIAPSIYRAPIASHFDTSLVKASIRDALVINPEAVMVNKATVPYDHASQGRAVYCGNLIFPPEYLCEGKVLYGKLHPYDSHRKRTPG